MSTQHLHALQLFLLPVNLSVSKRHRTLQLQCGHNGARISVLLVVVGGS
jgi:hypothetical protein